MDINPYYTGNARILNSWHKSREKHFARMWRIEKCGSTDFKDLIKSFNEHIRNLKKEGENNGESGTEKATDKV